MDVLRSLPIGLQYFAEIRKYDCIYIDKTQYIYELCRPPSRPNFLSRPRRFGKSLTIDTISELFSGNKALFEGLWIADKWDWSETYPVIRFSLDRIGHEEGLKNALVKAVEKVALTFELTIKNSSPGLAFEELFDETAEELAFAVLDGFTIFNGLRASGIFFAIPFDAETFVDDELVDFLVDDIELFWNSAEPFTRPVAVCSTLRI